MKAVILTTYDQWFRPYTERLSRRLNNASVYYDHSEVTGYYDVIFILGYHQILPESFIARCDWNLVVHESALPDGRGWSPLFWQVLEGRREIVFTMFNASCGVDSGDIVMQRILGLSGFELNAELREKQAMLTMTMCEDFYRNPARFSPSPQSEGAGKIYRRRTPDDSQLDIDKSIREQFNLLRTVDNDEYPAFFYIDGKKYKLKIQDFND